MSEWAVSLEASHGAGAGDETLESIHDALDGDPVALMPVVGFRVPLPIITARIQVEAESTEEAEDIARASFERALAAAGVNTTCNVSSVEAV
jgi:hypothetical protein